MLNLGSIVIVSYNLMLSYVPEVNIDPRLKPYYDYTMTTIKQRCTERQYNNTRRITIQFEKMKLPVIGECLHNLFGSYKININEEYWEEATYVERKELFLHESTHCIFLVGHSDNPLNYMYPYLNQMSEQELDRQFNELLTQKCGGK